MSENRVSQNVVVNNPQGLHLRAADLFAKLAVQFDSQVTIAKGSQRADGKSIMEIISLLVEPGTEVTIEAVGSDAEEALEALTDLVRRNFDGDGPSEEADPAAAEGDSPSAPREPPS